METQVKQYKLGGETMYTGTIQSQVSLQMLDLKWQKKKQDINSKKDTEGMTQDEILLDSLERQAQTERERSATSELYTKLKTGGTLTEEEIAYLKEHDPEALAEYEKAQTEKKAYENALKNCRTKEDVQRLKLNRMGSFAAQAKEIASNPYIPKDKKVVLMQRLNNEVCMIRDAHQAFEKSRAYEELPEEQELRREAAEEQADETKARIDAKYTKGEKEMANLYGVSAYQQTNSTWNNTRTNNTKTDRKNAEKTDVQKTETDSVKTTTFNPADTTSSLVPTTKNGYGTVIGDVELSDKAKDYYNKLKAKFGNMDFILVSKDMKSQVQANAAAYGNASKQVVLIDDEKIEKMATDESFRRKYEGIIAMSQAKLQEAKNSLTSSGASVNNFGMSVDANGKATFFATVEKAAKKKAEKKAAEKKADEKRAEESKNEETTIADEKEYVQITAGSMEELIDKVSSYAYENSERNVLTESEKSVGQKFDFRG